MGSILSMSILDGKIRVHVKGKKIARFRIYIYLTNSKRHIWFIYQWTRETIC